MKLQRDGESLASGGGTGSGHLSIVHGCLGDNTCDAAILTNDDRGTLGVHSQTAIGSRLTPRRSRLVPGVAALSS